MAKQLTLLQLLSHFQESFEVGISNQLRSKNISPKCTITQPSKRVFTIKIF